MVADPTAGPTGPPDARRWAVLDLALLALALVLLLTLLLWRPGTGAAAATDVDDLAPAAREASLLQREVVAAAGAGTVAFLEVDHEDMPAVVDRVLDGATGAFAEEYAAGRRELVRSVERRSATVDASLRAVGVEQADGSSAVAVVAADSLLTDADTGAEGRLRKHRLRLELVRQDGRWLVSGLEFVR